MQTRSQKWKRYREQIKNLPDEKFPDHSKGAVRIQSPGDEAVIMDSRSISSSRLGIKRNNTPYGKYLERKKNLMIVKFAILGAAIIIFVIAYFVFVKGA